jgi:hypothetical protein
VADRLKECSARISGSELYNPEEFV